MLDCLLFLAGNSIRSWTCFRPL